MGTSPRDGRGGHRWEVFDREPRKAVLNGAQLLAAPATTPINQDHSEQIAFAKVRAVEHDRYVLVAGTTGISAVIAPDGDELARTEFFQPATENWSASRQRSPPATLGSDHPTMLVNTLEWLF